MGSWFRTPRRGGWLVWLAILLFVTAPFVKASYYSIELHRGSFPPDGDSLGIPIGAFTIGLLITAPFTVGFLWFCLHRYPGSVSLVAWNRARPYWSLGWSALFGAIVLDELRTLRLRHAAVHPLDAAQAVAAIYFFLALRALVIVRAQDRPDSLSRVGSRSERR